MKQKSRASLAVLGLSLSLSLPAATPIALQKISSTELKKQFYIALPGTKQVRDPINALVFVQNHVDERKINHLRLQQTYQGFKVFGGYAILHTASHKEAMNGIVYQNLERDLGEPPRSLVKNTSLALQHFKKAYGPMVWLKEAISPIVYIDKHYKAFWAYEISLWAKPKNPPPLRPTAIVSATNFEPFLQWDETKTARLTTKGTGFGGNDKTGPYTYGGARPLLEMTRNRAGKDFIKCFMENNEVIIVDMQHHYSTKNKPMQFACKSAADKQQIFWTGYEGDGFDRDNGAFSVSNDALYAGYVVKRLYQDLYHVPVLTKTDGSPMPLVMRVHFAKNYQNAFWDGRQMTFGDGAKDMHPLVSLGIAAHEVSHGFTEQHSDLTYIGESGGINESFSDMAAQAAEFYAFQSNHWMIGAEVMKAGSGKEALRYMDIPSKDGHSIDTALDFHCRLNPHYASGVYNRLYYLLSTSPGWDPIKAFGVMVKANMDYWTPYDSFNEAACGVLSAAKDLRLPTEDIKKAMNLVAIDYQSCV